jgi:hypothetical protein
MAGGWWSGLGKAIEIVSAIAGGGGRAEPDEEVALQPRGMLGGFEARLAGVLVSALHEAFARDAARLDVEREQAEAERQRAEAALRLELARQEAERQVGQLRAAIGIDVAAWLASLLVIALHPPHGLVATVMLACAWTVLTAAIGVAFAAYGRVSAWASLAVGVPDAAPRHRYTGAASWLTVGGLGLTAASLIAVIVAS